MTILGGIGTLWGSVVGAALVVLLRDWLSTWTDAWGVVTGVIFVIIVLSFRRGLWGTLIGLRHPPRPVRLPSRRAAPGAEAPSGPPVR